MKYAQVIVAMVYVTGIVRIHVPCSFVSSVTGSISERSNESIHAVRAL